MLRVFVCSMFYVMCVRRIRYKYLYRHLRAAPALHVVFEKTKTIVWPPTVTVSVHRSAPASMTVVVSTGPCAEGPVPLYVSFFEASMSWSVRAC